MLHWWIQVAELLRLQSSSAAASAMRTESTVMCAVVIQHSAHSCLVFLLPETHIGPAICNAPFGNSLSSAECTSWRSMEVPTSKLKGVWNESSWRGKKISYFFHLGSASVRTFTPALHFVCPTRGPHRLNITNIEKKGEGQRPPTPLVLKDPRCSLIVASYRMPQPALGEGRDIEAR